MDIIEILKKYDAVIPEEKLGDFNKDFRVNFKSNKELQKVKDDLNLANGKIKEYEDNNFEAKLKELQEKYDTDIAAKQSELDALNFDTKLNKSLAGIEFSSDRIKNSVISEIKSKNFQVGADGQFEGLNDYLKDLYNKEPNIFKAVDSGIHTWAGGSETNNMQSIESYDNLFGRLL